MKKMADAVDLVVNSGNEFFNKILHICLYIGAVFQLICIFSAVLLPQENEHEAVSLFNKGILSLVTTLKHKRYSRVVYSAN